MRFKVAVLEGDEDWKVYDDLCRGIVHLCPSGI